MVLKNYIFIGDCVGNPFEDVNILSEVIDGGKEISRKIFLHNCNVEGIKLFGESLEIETKKYPNSFSFYYNEEEDVYFFENSAIEYFFKKVS